jgi:hypothetical protein
MLVGLHNELDASTVSISIRPLDTICVVGLGKTFGESRGGVVLWEIRYDDVDRYESSGVDARM